VRINQVNFSYNTLEDRLLFRFNTLNKTEFRMWLTRAMSLKLLAHLHHFEKVSLLREQPGYGGYAMETMVAFMREAVVAKADYVQPYSTEAETLPLGAVPVLVTNIMMDSSKPVTVLTFKLSVGQEVNLSLNQELGIAICKLLTNVMEGLDWGTGIAKELPMTEVGKLSEKMMLH